MRSRPLLAVAVAVVGGKNGEGTDDQSQNSEQPLVRRSRKQQYIDEITDVEAPLVSRPRSSAAVTTAVSAAARASSWNRTSSHAARTWTA